MALEGEYEPSPEAWVRDQVEEYESSGGERANTLRDTGLPVIIVTTSGNKSAAYPLYTEYQTKTDRQIPVLLASRRT